jgi:hypothetical protein
MKLLALLSLLVAAPALADPPASYVVNVWASPNGHGIAITVGPLHTSCDAVRRKVSEPDLPIPPDMSLSVSRCTDHEHLPMYLLPFGCQAVQNKPMAALKGVSAWLYECFRP